MTLIAFEPSALKTEELPLKALVQLMVIIVAARVFATLRGLMGLVVANVGRDLGVIPNSVFCMLTLMALATTVMTTPLLLHFMRHTELEPFIRESEFGRGICSKDEG